MKSKEIERIKYLMDEKNVVLDTSLEGIFIYKEGDRCDLVQKGDLYYLKNSRGLFYPSNDKDVAEKMWEDVNSI